MRIAVHSIDTSRLRRDRLPRRSERPSPCEDSACIEAALHATRAMTSHPFHRLVTNHAKVNSADHLDGGFAFGCQSAYALAQPVGAKAASPPIARSKASITLISMNLLRARSALSRSKGAASTFACASLSSSMRARALFSVSSRSLILVLSTEIGGTLPAQISGSTNSSHWRHRSVARRHQCTRRPGTCHAHGSTTGQKTRLCRSSSAKCPHPTSNRRVFSPWMEVDAIFFRRCDCCVRDRGGS